MKKLFLIDAYALIFRFYYAFIGRPMRNADGVNTSAVFGFVRYINEIIRRENPHYLGVAFDPPAAISGTNCSPTTKPTAAKRRRTSSSRFRTLRSSSKRCESR